MFKLKVALLIALPVFASHAVAQEPAGSALPKFTVTPVEQNEPWAVEWWKTRHVEKRRQAKSAEIDVVFIGDSITHGWENEGAAVWREYYQGRNAFNLGFAGDRTEHVLWRLQDGAVSGMTPSLVVLMIGTNNTGHRMDPAAYTAEGIERIVSDLRTKLPGTKVLVLGIFPRHVSPNNEMRLRNDAINQRISAVDDGESVHYLDIGANFVKEDGTIRADLMPDLLHLNPAGYRVWAEAMEPTIKRLLQD